MLISIAPNLRFFGDIWTVSIHLCGIKIMMSPVSFTKLISKQKIFSTNFYSQAFILCTRKK